MIGTPHFDDAGRPVPAVEPSVGFDYDALDREAPRYTVDEFFEFLLTGAADARVVGERLVMLAFVTKHPRAPKSLRELARWMDVSHVTARARLNTFRLCFQREFADLLTAIPIDEYE